MSGRFRKEGFTLLELLIVIIIIGILSTLAMPQFFRAVERTRWAEAKSILGAIRGGQIRYKAEHGVYTTSINDLDCDITPGKYFSSVSPYNAYPPWVGYAYRNSVQDTFGLVNNYIVIQENGTFGYSAGVPAWLK